MNKTRLINYLMLLLAGLVLAGMFLLASDAATRRVSMVIFTANWCANCRDVIPVVQQVSSQNGVGLQMIDVDTPNAPRQAKQLGLGIPTQDLPQVYLIDDTGTRLVIDGSQYSYGQAEKVRATVMQALQGSLR